MSRGLLLLCLLVPACIFAGLEISAPSAPRDAAPKSIVSLPFTVLSDTDGDAAFSLELPDGWSLISPLNGRQLSAGRPAKLLLSVAVPAQARAGEHSATLHVNVGEMDSDSNSLAGLPALSCRPFPAIRTGCSVSGVADPG